MPPVKEVKGHSCDTLCSIQAYTQQGRHSPGYQPSLATAALASIQGHCRHSHTKLGEDRGHSI